ncbi:MAG: hypothetical protein AVDCRST_MAG49-1118 [uncultured Thermomicrobiales bacterium]|uniref:Calcineurin-like phosphoesterase domain-containing protein n=1 Tax=uncultured Thermomicrobiales bacterium TaxID=1645740 RepID=A0A6J4UAF9_9BACT|nr:MAG: hypothetical protein AVDCRST_MAG49-1118 [uncultured Thermomicrobiales bacterium]
MKPGERATGTARDRPSPGQKAETGVRVGVFSDIHGNLVALEAVLADLERVQPDWLVCLGDVAATGPQPRESVRRLRALGCPVVMGNADAALLGPSHRNAAGEGDAARFAEIDAWCAAQLTADDLGFVRRFAARQTLPLAPGHALLCYHGSPRSYDDVIVATTPDEDLDALLGDAEVTALAGGHTHAPMLRRHGERLVLNPGSVGLPYEVSRSDGRIRNPPWAEYAVVAWSDAGLQVAFRRVPVEVAAVTRAALDSGMPHAAWWAGGWTGWQ